ncbi:TetR family transcriptional regulator [Antrihabitans cavernicola]|uniref:TetR family transcriptional regulator n=1 Tax=Antrihabitans cavernicola TaxID=2495913 RepID=A0A5A7SC06_9NOCA|nr:TetR family transcriptional regulator [Spelaeibacter cavernicola]KAA0022869.1 TetR family transcriptional regulator [Spelaeibacter cavernicola]
MTGPQSRAERKEQTRTSLLNCTLELTSDRGLAAVSLREIARAAGIVPTAFYRHFESMDALGLALVDDGMRALRVMLRDARKSPIPANGRESLAVLSKHVRANREIFLFLYRERYGGSAVVRRAIETELRLIVGELTIDLSRMPGFGAWDTDDLDMAADLVVSSMLEAMAAFLRTKENGREEEEVSARTEKQMRVLLLGLGQWKPRSER